MVDLRVQAVKNGCDNALFLCPAVLVKTRVCGSCLVSRAHKTSSHADRWYFVFAVKNPLSLFLARGLANKLPPLSFLTPAKQATL